MGSRIQDDDSTLQYLEDKSSKRERGTEKYHRARDIHQYDCHCLMCGRSTSVRPASYKQQGEIGLLNFCGSVKLRHGGTARNKPQGKDTSSVDSFLEGLRK